MAAEDFVGALLAAGCSNTQLQTGTQASNSLATARRLVLDRGGPSVTQELQQHVQSASPVACKAVKAVLLALRSTTFSHAASEADAAACNEIRNLLFGQLPTWVCDVPGDEQQFAADLVTAVMPDVDHLSTDSLAALITATLTAVEQKRPHAYILLELLPACLAALQAAPGPATSTQAAAAANAADAASQQSQQAGGAAEAAKHRDAAIHRLSHCQWQPEQACQVLTVLKSIPLTPEQLKALLEKAVRACRHIGLQQLPPILYQVLLLAGSAPGMRCHALRLIMCLFDQLVLQQGAGAAAAAAAAAADDDAQQQEQGQEQEPASAALPSATLLQVQATLLMHISTMLRYDAALSSEWLKWAAAEAGSSSTHYFLLQVLLTMSRHPKHEQTVQQLLKKRIMQACEDDAAGSNDGSVGSTCGGCSGWMAGLRPVSKSPSLQDTQDGLLKAVRCSTYASELVAPGLLQLADVLISTRCSGPLHVVIAMRQPGGACSLPQQAPAAARAVVLGLQLLQEVFAVHAEARGEVLKIVQAKLACNDLSAALPIVLLLGRITQQHPALLGDYLPQLKECMGSFAGLSSDTAMALLLAVWPLCRVRSDLQDFVVMLLRKMIYRQDVDGRLIATRGFLRLICQHLQDSPLPQPVLDPSAASCSQASLSQRASLSSSKGVNLLQELSGVLRRALSQQAPVREALYEGILQILAADPASSELLAELLLPHLRSYTVEGDEQLPPLQLHKCAQLQHGEAVLVEPLPALLSCVYRLTSSTAQAVREQSVRGPGSLGGSENWMGDQGEDQEQQEQSMTAALKACFDSVRKGLSECQLEHFELPAAADMSPLQPDGLLGQLHAANLLGALQAVIEAAVADVNSMVQAQPDADLRDGDAVNKLGAELQQLFSLYSDVYQLAMEGSRGGSRKGKKPAADGGVETSTAPAVGQKRAKPSDGFTPVHKQRPIFSAACLAQLCNAIVDDGLMHLPSSYDVSNPDHHAQLAREAGFRACVLRSCAALLEDAQAAAASALLMREEGSGEENTAAPACVEVLELGPALFKVAKLVMQTATAGGRPSCKPSNSSGGGAGDSSRRAAGAPSAAAGDGCETLEHLSAAALLQLLKLADATQQMAALFSKLPRDGADAAAVQQSSSSSCGDTAAEVVAAVTPHLPQLLACTDSLLEQGCAKEAQVMVECLALLGKRLRAPVAAAGSADGQQQQQGQQKPAEAASAALSAWAHEALKQDEPEVKLLPLVRGLLELFIRFHGQDCAVAIKITLQGIKEVVGDTEQATQATQEHGSILPMLMSSKTAQPACMTPLGFINDGLEQLEKLTAANFKAGVYQEGDSTSVAERRLAMADRVCKRVQELMDCLQVLMGTIVGMPSVIDMQTKVATRAYKLLATLAKAYQLPKRPSGASGARWALSPKFEALVAYVHKDLTPCLYSALKELNGEEISSSLVRVKKDAKLLPALVFALEEWERKLMLTGKAANKNLLRDAKRSWCRDFKVKFSSEPQAQQQRRQQPAAAAPRAAAAAAAGGAGSRSQPGASASAGQPQTSGSRGSGASHGRSTSQAGGSSSKGGSSAGRQQQQEEEEEEVAGADEADTEMREAAGAQRQGQLERMGTGAGENARQQQHQKRVGMQGLGRPAKRAPLQRRQV